MFLLDELKKYRLILASHSPRRQQLMKASGFHFDIIAPAHENENFPQNMPTEEIPPFLAKMKASYIPVNHENEILITADTLVICNNKLLGKPIHDKEAIEMLSLLSNNTHIVITGVCLKTKNQIIVFSDTTRVTFKKISREEIDYYIKNFNPFDKAGGYGAQDWIGLIGIKEIVGSYYNVMGLPIEKLYTELEKMIKNL